MTLPAPSSKRFRIVFVLPALVAGGAERVMITLMNGLDRNLFDPALVTIIDKGTLGPLVRTDIPVRTLGKRGVFSSMPALFRTLRQLRPDIVVSTMAHMNFALLAMKPLFPGTALIVREAVVPSSILGERPRQAKLIARAYRTLYPRATMVISPAQAIIDEFKDRLGMNLGNYRLLRNPVAVAAIREAAKALPTACGDGVRFVAAGRLHRQKGFDRLIDIMADHRNAPWQLTILGEGEERAALEAQIARLDLGGVVTLPGAVVSPWGHYAAADAFLLPSRWEGLPNVALEALACGTKVIASAEAGGIAEVAAMADVGSVAIAATMAEFAAVMQRVVPEGKARPGRSRLHAESDSPVVVDAFETLLLEAVRISVL